MMTDRGNGFYASLPSRGAWIEILWYADDMDCDLVETTAHSAARPSHQVWQGKVFSRSGNGRYPDFESSIGYGTGPGLCG